MAQAEIILLFSPAAKMEHLRKKEKEKWEPFRVPQSYGKLFPGHIWHKQIKNMYE